MPLPNFLIIGAAKSGTTALYWYLRSHPEIFMSSRKEPHYFSYTEETKNTAGPSDYIKSAITDYSEYLHLFDKVTNQKAIGEASPTYIYVPGTAERIKMTIPAVKLIAILRNPADRAYSAYMHLIRDGKETINTFKEALDLEDERVNKNWGPIYHFTKSGFYYEQLSRYYNMFPSENIKVIIYDDFVKEPLAVMHNLFDFLGVDSSFVPDMSTKPNVSGVPKNKTLQRILDGIFGKPNPIRSISRLLFSAVLRNRVTTYLRNKNLERDTIPSEYRQHLLKVFTPDILKLEKLIDRDLSVWLDPKIIIS